MNMNNPDQDFSDQWKELTVACCHPQALEPDDLWYITVKNTWDDVQKQILEGSGTALELADHQEIRMLARSLIHLKVFVDGIASNVAPNFNPSVFWGFNGLIIKLAQDEDGAVPRIPRMLRQICHKIEVLNSYCIAKSRIIPQMKEACFEIFITLFTFFSSVVKFMRSGSRYSMIEGFEWQTLERQASSVFQDLDEAASRIERISRSTERILDISQIQQFLAASGLSLQPEVQEPAKLPCFIFPPFRISRFFDRSEVVLKIDHFFEEQQKEKSIQSLALWGLGGVGKSCVALRYAEAKVRDGELDAMFWIRSEKDVTIRQSFTDIAMKLKLADASPADHDENKNLVLNWLQYTKSRWLLVYDNAEDLDLIRSYWPSATRGKALITTRRSAFAFHLASDGLEITAWDADMGSKFLLHLLSTEIGEQLTKEEINSANELSKKLSGHALAISQMAGLIHRRSWSISEFVRLYNQQPDKMHGVFGNSSINALWDISFKSLDPESRIILGIICFLEPDQIPEALFEYKSPENEELPESLKFTQDIFVLSTVFENLLTSALIKRDKDRRAFTVHRLVQAAFKQSMTPEQRQQSFNDATLFLFAAFPRLGPNTGQLYPVWPVCALYLPHALSMLNAFQQERKNNPEFKVLVEYCMLNNNVARYLFETNGLHDMLEVTSGNLVALNTKPSMSHHQWVIAEGSLASYRGQIFSLIGKSAEGCELLKKCYDVNCSDDPRNPQAECYAASNYAHGLGSMNRFDEAVKWSERAIEHWFEWQPELRSSAVYNAPLKLRLGLPLLFKGKLREAREILTAGRDQLESSRPYQWQVAARFYFALGTLERLEKKFESAEALYMEAQNKWLSDGNIRTDPFNAAIMYKLGCTTLDQGKVEAAVKHTRDALVVTSIHRAYLTPEHARCMFKLSEALQQEPRHQDEANFLRDEAERLLYQCNPDAQNPGLEKSYDDLVNLYWR